MVKSTEQSSSWDVAIDSSNIGFKLLKKQGWKEGTGLGISQQGILVPLHAELKNNKRGLGAENTTKRKAAKPHSIATDSKQVDKKSKKLSKKMLKMIEHEKHLQEKEFERAFFREFWPDNV
ncbi:G-patch domain-containing protein [Hirschfeldia incana]|nr:G-patch domain-containing protein [Hirschfeldia incana]